MPLLNNLQKGVAAVAIAATSIERTNAAEPDNRADGPNDATTANALSKPPAPDSSLQSMTDFRPDELDFSDMVTAPKLALEVQMRVEQSDHAITR